MFQKLMLKILVDKEGHSKIRVRACSDAFKVLSEVEFLAAGKAVFNTKMFANYAAKEALKAGKNRVQSIQETFEICSKEAFKQGSFLRYINPQKEAETAVDKLLEQRANRKDEKSATL